MREDVCIILSSAYERMVVLFTGEGHQCDMSLHRGSWQKTLILQSSWPHPQAGRKQLAMALMKDPINHILNTFISIIYHAHLLPQRPPNPMLHVQSQL